jgi:hypothetical protein
MSAPRKIEIEGTANGFRVRVINAITPNQWEYYPASAVKSVVGVSAIGMGVRQADNNRLNPIQYDDKLDFVISFIDENNNSPVRYNVQDVDNQVTWTANAAGLAIALADINGWLADGSGATGRLAIENATSLAPNSDVTTVAASITSVTLLASNANRRSAIILNDGTDILYVKYGTTASTASFTWKLEAGEYAVVDDYNGRIDGIWDVASVVGAKITELTF